MGRRLCLIYKQNIGKTSLLADTGRLRCVVPAWGCVNRGCTRLLLTETPSWERMERDQNLTSCAKSSAQGLAGNISGPLLKVGGHNSSRGISHGLVEVLRF